MPPNKLGENTVLTPGKIPRFKIMGVCCLPWIVPSLAYLGGFHEIGWVIAICAPALTLLIFALARPQWSLSNGVVRLPRFPFRTRRIPVAHIARLHGHLTAEKEWAQYDLLLLDGTREMIARQYVGTGGVNRVQMKMASANQRSGAILLAGHLGLPVEEDADVAGRLPYGSQPIVTFT